MKERKKDRGKRK